MMNNKIYCLAIFLSGAMSMSGAEEYRKIAISKFTQLIHGRFYIVARVTKSMRLFEKIEHNAKRPQDLFNIDELPPVEHIVLQKTLEQMHRTQSITPLLKLWESIVAYKYLDDLPLIDEFIKIVCRIAKNLLTNIMQVKRGIYSVEVEIACKKALNLPLECMLDITDHYINEEPSIKHADEFYEYINSMSETVYKYEVAEWKNPVHPDHVMQRFYYLRRLQKTLTLVHHSKNEGPLFFAKKSEDYSFSLGDAPHFNHPRVALCAHMMKQSGSIHPFLNLIRDVKHYKFITDTTFTKDFLLITYALCKNFLTNHLKNSNKASSAFDITTALQALEEINSLADKINSLPIEDILQIIDLITQELPALANEYELNSTMTWKEWFSKYWWSPFVIAGTITYQLLQYYKPVPAGQK